MKAVKHRSTRKANLSQRGERKGIRNIQANSEDTGSTGEPPKGNMYHSLDLSPFHPDSSAISSAARSPIPRTVSIGLILGIDGKILASAMRMPRKPLTFKSGSTTASGSV